MIAKRLKVLFICLANVGFLLFIAGMNVSSGVKDGEGKLQLRELSITDDAGRTRIRFVCNDEGPEAVFLDEKGTTRTRLSMSKLGIHDVNGSANVKLQMEDDGTASMELASRKRTSVAWLSCVDDNLARFVVMNHGSEVTLSTSKEVASVAATNVARKSLVTMQSFFDLPPMISVYDTDSVLGIDPIRGLSRKDLKVDK